MTNFGQSKTEFSAYRIFLCGGRMLAAQKVSLVELSVNLGHKLGLYPHG